MNEPGKIDLGEVSLPYYDPKRHAYAIARAKLGEIEVKNNPSVAFTNPITTAAINAATGPLTANPGTSRDTIQIDSALITQ